MSAAVYSKGSHDLICFSQYMLVAGKASIVFEPGDFLEVRSLEFVDKDQKIKQIGDDRQTSAGFSKIRMLPGSFLKFAGHFEGMALFIPFENRRRKFFNGGRKIPGCDYVEMFVALYNEIATDQFIFARHNQTTRSVARVFEFL